MLVVNKPLSLSPFATSDIIGHVTMGFVIYGFLLCGQFKPTVVLHGCLDIMLQRFWGHDVDLLGSCDVNGHATIRFAICGFLLVVNLNRLSISNEELLRYWVSKFWGNYLDPLRSRDVICHVTIGLAMCDFHFPMGSQFQLTVCLAHSYRWSSDPHFCVSGAKLGLQHFATLCMSSLPRHVVWAHNRHIWSTGLVIPVFGPSRWKRITGVKNWGKIGEGVIGFWPQWDR